MRPCPTRIRARAVMVRTGSGPVDYIADRVQVIGVSLSSSGDDVDRSEVLDPLAPPRASVVLGRRMANVTIEQEVYGDLSQHAALFRACPVEVTQSGAGIAGSVSSSPSARGKRCTIEIVEVGGNRYRIEDALGVFALSGAPGERLLLTFDLQGELVPVADAGLAPMAVVMPPAPLVYRNASLLASEQTFATCPEFSFDAGMTLGTTDYTCSPDGGQAAYVQRDAQAVLALTGVLSGRESIDRHWAAARVPVCGATLDATVWSDGASSSVRVELRGCATVDPALAEVEGFAAYDLAVGAGAWSLVWDIDEGVPLPIELGAAIWLDLTDASTLFVDAEGTIPCAPGDPIGQVANKGSLGATGNGVQPVSASRPVWSLADGGRAEFNGVSSVMTIEHRMANWGFSVATDIRAYAGGYFVGIGSNNEGYWSVARRSSETVGNRIAEVGATSGDGFNVAAYKTGATQTDRIASVAVYQTVGTSIATSSERVVSTHPIIEPEPRANISNIRIGAIRLTSLFAEMTIKHLFVFDRPLTVSEQDKLIAWLEAQSV